MPFRDINTKVQRNEILAVGECINAYATTHWSGRLIGNIKLLRRVNPTVYQEEWWVEYITGHGSLRYTTTTPESVPTIGS